MKTTKMFAACALAAMALPMVSFADRTPPSGTATLYGDWSIQQQVSRSAKLWTNETSSTRIAWTQDSYGIVEKVNASGSFSFNSMKFWGLKWNVSVKRWASFSGDLHFEGGGVEMPMSGGMLSLGDLNGSSPYLTSSQTWTGPESGRAHFAFGHDDYLNYYKVSANGNWCPEWTLEKGMNVWLTWTNQFTKTDVTVKYPARIWLEKKWTTSNVAYEGGPALRAKTLTLSGDGVMWEAGGTASYGHRYKTPELEPEMNSLTVSPSLTLKDGADLLGRSAGWDIPTLAVTGTGESAFDGSWKFRRATTDVSIASGAVLALTGDVADGGVSAGLNVTGSGELKLDPSTFRLTGPLTLGANVTLVLAGHGEFSHRIDGGKEIRIESDGNSPTNVVSLRAAALAGFTGSRVTVASGKAIVDAKAGVSVVEDGGTRIDLSAASGDAWVVTDAVREEAEITVGSGETLYICGNGLTAATALILNGGRVAFLRSAAIGSPVTLADSSSIGSENVSTIGTLLGRIDGVCESAKSLALKGAGTVNFAGGGRFENVEVYVKAGSANLMSNRFDIAYAGWGVYEGDYLGIRDGAFVNCPWKSTGGVFGCTVRPKEGYKSVVEVCTNSTVCCNQNNTFYLGRYGSDGVLRISGGTVEINHGTQIYVGHTAGCRGVIEMNDGLFLTDQSFRVGSGASGRIVWRGGRIKLRSEFWTYAGNGSRYFDGTSSNLTFTIAGPDCVLDLNGAPAFTNVVANSLNAGSWRWEDGGRLTVTNGGVFVMNRFPENGCVAVKDCSLLIADEAEPAIGEIGFAGTAATDVISAADGLTLAAQGVRVLSGGEWDASQVEGISWSDLAFDTGAVFRIPMTDYDTVTTCSIPGALTLGDTLGFHVVRNGYRFGRSQQIAVVHAAGGATGNPSCTPVVERKGLSMFVSGDDLVLDYKASGMVISYR